MNNVEVSKTPAATNAADTPDPSLAAVTGQLLDLVIQMEGLVPELKPHDPQTVARVTQGAKFAHALIAPTITTVNSITAVPAGLFNVDRGRDALAYRDELYPVAQRLGAFVEALYFSINSKLAESGGEALQTYTWAKRAENGPIGPALRPYLDEMRRVVRKAINFKGKDSTPETPAPQGQSFLAERHRPAEAESEVANG